MLRETDDREIIVYGWVPTSDFRMFLVGLVKIKISLFTMKKKDIQCQKKRLFVTMKIFISKNLINLKFLHNLY